MSILLWKRLIARRITFRLITILCFAVGVFAAWIQQPRVEQTPTRFLVNVLPDAETILQKRELPKITLQKILQNRDLSKYDFGGVIFDCESVLQEMQNCETFRNNARNFVLEHWQSKKRAYLIIDFEGFDSLSTAYVFIEPDKNNNWQIIWKRELTRDPFGTIEVTTARFAKLEIGADKNYARRFGKYYLAFFDKNGKGIESF